jgi:hypothetical protein
MEGAGSMKFGLLYEDQVARPWTDTSVSDCSWEALGGMRMSFDLVIRGGTIGSEVSDGTPAR